MISMRANTLLRTTVTVRSRDIGGPTAISIPTIFQIKSTSFLHLGTNYGLNMTDCFL
jgi:hypothetical protein